MEPSGAAPTNDEALAKIDYAVLVSLRRLKEHLELEGGAITPSRPASLPVWVEPTAG